MQTMLRVAITCFLLVGCAKPGPSEPEMLAKINHISQQSVQALLNKDYKALVRTTYPPFVERTGGIDKVSAMAEIAMRNVTIDSYERERATKVYPDGDNRFAIVPVRMGLTAEGHSVTSKGFLLAVSTDRGSTWHLLDGSALDQVMDILPKLPAAMPLPKVEVTPSPR